MGKSRAWIALLTIVTVIVMWYSGRAAYKVYDYSRYTSEAISASVEWSVVNTAKDKYQIRGDFRYTVDSRPYEGSTLITHTTYRNPWAASERVKALDGQGPWRVWYVTNNPARSTLQKSFPLKECVSTAVLLALLLYFAGLGYYVSRDTQQPLSPGKQDDKDDRSKK